MKKFCVLMLALICCISLYSCSERSKVGDRNYEELAELIQVDDHSNLYYDSNTKIVYIIFSEKDWPAYRGYGYMSPYYAPNGLPYMYDVNSHILIEIDGGKTNG